MPETEDDSRHRWRIRPTGSNWGDFGPDDQLGRLNLITPQRRRKAVEEVREGIAFCLSLPLDFPRVRIHPRRRPPEISYAMRGDDPVVNFPMSEVNPGQSDVVCDDNVYLSLQFSTQWDSLCHIGQMYPDSNGELKPTYYNGFQGGQHICGPVDYLSNRRPMKPPFGAKALGIETIAETGLQGRGVMIDLFAHVGLARTYVGYNELMRILELDRVEPEAGDILCFRTGFDRALLAAPDQTTDSFDSSRCAGLDGSDPHLLNWLDASGAAALVSDNEAVELLPTRSTEKEGTHFPLHNLCLFKLGMPLGEMFLLSDLADWLRGASRSRFLFTAPPLRLPGAVGSPVSGVGTV